MATENNRDSIFSFSVYDRESSDSCSQSAVCAYKLSDISEVFSGTFLAEREDTGSWDIYRGEKPVPNPGSVSVRIALFAKLFSLTRNLPWFVGAYSQHKEQRMIVK